ncbi:MAG: hypothetical protein ACKVN9_01730 [Methylophilaceae bacterium]
MSRSDLALEAIDLAQAFVHYVDSDDFLDKVDRGAQMAVTIGSMLARNPDDVVRANLASMSLTAAKIISQDKSISSDDILNLGINGVGHH